MYIGKQSYNLYQSKNDVRIQEDVFEVDEFIAPIISLLNKKGYITTACCSGHVTDCGEWGGDKLYSCGYIAFVSDTELPFNTISTINSVKSSRIVCCVCLIEDRIVLRISYKETNNIKERYIDIMNTMIDLYNWAESLQDRNQT